MNILSDTKKTKFNEKPVNKDIQSPQYLPLQFTNNAQVFYKSHSLSSGGGGSGVRNYRHKQRKT